MHLNWGYEKDCSMQSMIIFAFRHPLPSGISFLKAFLDKHFVATINPELVYRRRGKSLINITMTMKITMTTKISDQTQHLLLLWLNFSSCVVSLDNVAVFLSTRVSSSDRFLLSWWMMSRAATETCFRLCVMANIWSASLLCCWK